MAYGAGQPIPAAGRTIDLRVDGEWLLGQLELTEKAADMVRAGEYLYTSVVLDFESRDRTTNSDIGAELLQVGLVNDPFIDGQQALMLRRALGENMKIELRKLLGDLLKLADVKAIGKVLNELPEDASDEAILTLVKAELAKQAALAGDAPAEEVAAEPAPAEPALSATPVAPAVELQVDAVVVEEATVAGAEDVTARLMEIIGTAEVADVLAYIETNAEALASLATGVEGQADAAAALSKLPAAESRIRDLTAKVDKLEAAETARNEATAAQAELARTESAKAEVAELIRCGRASEEERETLVTAAIKHPAWFKANAAARPASAKHTRLSARPRGAPNNTPAGTVDTSTLTGRELNLYRHYKKTGLYKTPAGQVDDAECIRLARQPQN